jgi:Cu2+-exporting ATPase
MANTGVGSGHTTPEAPSSAAQAPGPAPEASSRFPLSRQEGETGGEDLCAHCGEPLPSSPPAPLPRDPPSLRFCCDGCATVYQVLHGAGLEGYYQVRSALGERDTPARAALSDFPEFDSDAFSRLYVRATPRGTREVDVYLEGVHCAACVWLVERLPAAVPGCVSAHLDFTRSRATLEWDPARAPLSSLARFLSSLGYRPHPWRAADVSSLKRREERRLWMRIGVAAAVAMNVMFLAIALYAGEHNGLDTKLEQLFRRASLILFLPSVGWCAQTFFSGAIASLRAGVLHMDLPLSLGIGVGFAASAWRTIQGSGDIYFDSLAMLITLLLVARWLQRRGQRAAGDAAELLSALTASTARVVTEAGIEVTPIDALLPGMTVEVRTGESIPADGRVVSGSSFLDRSVLSGESRPMPVQPDDRVFAGTVNLQAPLRVVLEATGEETRIGRLMRLMEQAAVRRAPIVQLADRITGWFVGAVLALAVLTAAGWAWIDPARAVQHTIALLIVTCPCALGMATPVALAVAIGRAARRGILIKGGDTVERLARARRILLDKTGTLTRGELALVHWTGDDDARALLLAVEQASSHPLARAAVKALDGAPIRPVEEVREVLGGGLTARWEGRPVVVGSRRFVEVEGGRLEPAMTAALDTVLEQAQTPVLVSIDGRVRGVAGFGDPLREDSKAAIDRLRAMGFRIGILSGDHPAVAAAVGRALGLDPAEVEGGLSPEQKLERVEAAVQAGPVVMVGDGVNDAAALSAATVGAAVHGGAEASLAAADVFLTRPGLWPVVEAIEGARSSLAVVRRNLAFSVGYNALGAALAVTGVMGPLLAALLMPFSSLTVVVSSLWRGGFKPADGPAQTERPDAVSASVLPPAAEDPARPEPFGVVSSTRGLQPQEG